MVDEIWNNFDANKDGVLDRDETKKFMYQTMVFSAVDEDYSDDAFDRVFDEMDSNGSGFIDKRKMLKFIRLHILNASYIIDQAEIDDWTHKSMA